jgi:prolyl 4-hydroxylase
MFGFRKSGPSPAVRKKWGASVSARLTADPRAVRIKTDAIEAYTVDDFLSLDQCRALVAIVDSNRRPSTLLSPTADPNFRTSESCDMDRWSEDVRPIDESIAAMLGIPPQNGETMQGQRYAPGQQFRAHHDYFSEGKSYYADVTAQGGQRTWTAMIYLNDVEEGGATWFPQAGFRALPKRGQMLVWNNMKPDGAPNVATLHEGMPVRRGVKYIVTKWFREDSWLPKF